MIFDQFDTEGLVESVPVSPVERGALRVGLNYLRALALRSADIRKTGSTAYWNSRLALLVEMVNADDPRGEAPYDRVCLLGACWALWSCHGNASDVFPGLDLEALTLRLLGADRG